AADPLRLGHRADRPDVRDTVRAGWTVRGRRRRADARRPRAAGDRRRARRARHRVVPVVQLRHPGAAGDARAGGGARRGAGAPRDGRPALRARRHAQAAGRDRLHRPAERVRDRPIPAACRGVLHDRHHRPVERRGARGGAGARALPRRAPRRARHDAGVLGRDRHRDGAPRFALRRRDGRRRPRQPERSTGLAADPARQPRGLRDQLLRHQAAVALPRAVRRPVRRLPDRAAVGAGQRADEDHRRDVGDPAARPAHRPADERLLHRARGRRRLLADAHLDAPLARAAARAAGEDLRRDRAAVRRPGAAL
ncbi:MAG: Probable protease htpX homolog 1, partial [uncultured Nocardioidaceae bacterium]